MTVLSWMDDALAQAIPQQDLETIQRTQSEIQRRNDERQRLLEQELREKRRRPPERPAIPKPDIPVLPQGTECFDVDRIELKGATLLSPADVEHLTGPYEGRCLTLAEVNTLLRDITNTYVERGYVTTRAYVEAQDLSDRTFEITVIEGYIEGIHLKDKSEREHNQLTTAFPGLDGGPLNLRDIEQGLDQMNRLPSNNATMTIEPGSKQGASAIVIENEAEKPWRLSFGTDNTGSPSTGERQGSISGEFDNLLDLNDFYSLTWSRDTGGTRGRRESESVSGYISIPYGYWTFTTSGSWFEYLSLIQGTNQSFISRGQTRTLKFDLERVIHRDADGKTLATASLKRYKSRNSIDDSLLDTSSYNLTTGILSLAHSRRLLGGVLSGGVDYIRGLRSFNATKDHDVKSDEAHAQFTKYSGNLSYYRPLNLDAVNLAWSLFATGQYSPQTLYGAEQITIGGKNSVRGFKDDTLSGDIGGYVRNELILSLPDIPNPDLAKAFGTIQTFIAYDFGALRHDEKDAEENGHVGGVAIGLRNAGGKARFDVTYARPVSSPGHITEDSHEVYFSLKFTL